MTIFFLVITTSIAKEEDGWILEDRDEFIMLSKNGEIIHGDKLRFAMYFDNCEKVHHLFSFCYRLRAYLNKEIRYDTEYMAAFNRFSYCVIIIWKR